MWRGIAPYSLIRMVYSSQSILVKELLNCAAQLLEGEEEAASEYQFIQPHLLSLNKVHDTVGHFSKGLWIKI